MTINTKRLLLRDLCEEDAGSVYTLFSNKDTMRYLDLPHPSIEHSQAYVAELLTRYLETPRRCYEMAVILTETNTLIGVVNLDIEHPYLKDARACIDYYFLPEYWGMGYATEAAKGLIQFGFETLEVNKIATGTLKCNVGSETVMKKCGMTQEAEFKQHAQFNGEWVNRIEYAILKCEYFSG
ncbi:MAG: GNAT family N-acetyltransferase [Oscillospiraceae bacterium]|nr:GNAT family N-acetyltransferase [Oscillospiraceae bacterium]